MYYSELTPNDEMKLIQYGLIDEDTITGDFPLNQEQMMVLGYGTPAIQGSSATPSSNPQIPNYKFDLNAPAQQASQRAVDLMGNGGMPQPKVDPQGMVFDSLDAVQSSTPAMRSDTIDYTTKMSLDSQNQEMQKKKNEQDLLDYKALIDTKNLNIGDKKSEFKTALQLQSIIDSDQYPVEAKKYALQKLRNRFGMSFDKMVPVNDEYGRLKGARVQSKGAIDQGLDLLFTAQARDFDDQKGYLESGFDKTMGLMGIGSRMAGHIQDHDRSGVDENTYYQTDEVEAIKDRQKVTIPTLENAIGNLYMREQGIEDPAQKAKIRNTRVGLQKMLDAERSPSGMEAVAEFGSMSLDPTILADLGLFPKGVKKLMQLGKVDNALDATRGAIRNSRNLVDDGNVLDQLDEVVVNPIDEIAGEVDEAPLNVSPMEEAKWSGEPSKVMPMPTFDNAPTQTQAPSGGSWQTKEMEMVPLNELDKRGIPRPLTIDFRSPNADATMKRLSDAPKLMTPRRSKELSKQNKARYTSKGELTDGKFWKKDLDGSNGVKTSYTPADATQFKRDGDNLIGLDPEVSVDGKLEKFGANKEIQKSADKYMDLAKEKYGVPKTDLNVYARIDPERSEAIAHEYEKMKHDPTNPEVRSAYAQLSKEMMDQYKTLIDDGWTFSFYPTDAKGNVIDPYGNPRNALKDMRENKHLYVYPTDDGFGTSATFDPNGNPLLAESGEKFGDKKAKLNDIFRAVHDVFGHGAEEVGFRARGEEHTWRSHARMFSPKARRALTSETRGQNSWLNFNPLTGKKNQTALVEDTDFADQKTGLMPKWVSESGLYDEDVVPYLNDLRESKGLDKVTGYNDMPTATKGKRHSIGDKFGANKRTPAKFTGMDESLEAPPAVKSEKDYTSNEGLNPVGKKLADVGKKISNSPKVVNQAFGNFLQGVGVGVSEMEANGLAGLANAIKQGGYRAFVVAPERQKQAMMDLIFDKSDVNRVIQELGAREGRLPKEFADQILESFASPKGGATGRAKEKQDKLWQGSKAREIEAQALGGKQYETPSKEISQWWDDFIKQKDPNTGELIDLPDDQRAIVEDIARSELGSALSSTALKKILGRAKQGKMSYPEILDTIRAIDNSLNWGAESSDAVEKVWELRKSLNDMIMGATRYQIESGALDDFFDGVDGVEAYEKLRKSLQNSTELKKDFLQYTKNKGKTSGLSEFEIDAMADKVANAFGKILSKQGQSGSKLENNTGYKILQRIDQKQGTDFADKVRVIWELYSNPQIEVKKVKGQNALSGYKLPARAKDDQWSQAEYFSKGGVADVVRKNWRSFKSLLMDWSQPRSDLGATELNKQLVDLVSSLVGKVPTTFIFNELQKRNIPARQIAQLIHPALANKSGQPNKNTSKDTSTKEDKKVMFNPKKKPLSEVGSK